MQFHEYVDLYQETKLQNRMRKGKVTSSFEQFYETNIRRLPKDYPDRKTLLGSYVSEQNWYRYARPLYKLYPSFVDCLIKLPLDRPPSTYQFPFCAIAICFSKGNEGSYNGNTINSMLISHKLIKEEQFNSLISFVYRCSDGLVFSYGFGIRQEESTIEQLLDSKKVLENSLVKIGLTVLLLKDDPQFVSPAIEQKNLTWTHQGWVDKGKREGKTEWVIGREFESIPHFRRPHLGLRWTGPGSKIPKIVLVRGSVVHREKMVTVPTEHLDQ